MKCIEQIFNFIDHLLLSHIGYTAEFLQLDPGYIYVVRPLSLGTKPRNIVQISGAMIQ